MPRLFLTALLLLCLLPIQAAAQAGLPLSYATTAVDEIGSTGSSSVALGVADYLFVNDAGLGFGGSNTDVFDVGESAVFGFPRPLVNVPGQFDLIISAFVGGLGATDNATVEVEVSDDGTNFVSVGTFDTQEARNNRVEDAFEQNFEAVKNFWIEFGAEDQITHVRLTNLAGTSEGLRLDALEGAHPDSNADHAFEIRFERYRADSSERFLIRLKNTSDELIGQPITGFYIGKLPIGPHIENTDWPLLGSDGVGQMICIDNCIGDADMIPSVPSATLAFSLDGATVAGPGIGLEPGRFVSHRPMDNMDLDGGGSYLTDFTFYVEFADGFRHDFDFTNDVEPFGNLGNQYQKYTYFSNNPSWSGPRPVHHYEAIELPEPSGFVGIAFGILALSGFNGRRGKRSSRLAN